MKKIYTTPKIETIAIFSEQAILAGSGGGSGQAIQNTSLSSGDEVGEGWFSGKKIWNQNEK